MAGVVWGGAAVAAVKLWLLHQGCVWVVGVGVVVSAAGKLWLLAQVKLGVVLLAVGCGGCLGGSWGQYSPWPWGQQLGWCASRQCVCVQPACARYQSGSVRLGSAVEVSGPACAPP